MRILRVNVPIFRMNLRVGTKAYGVERNLLVAERGRGVYLWGGYGFPSDVIWFLQ